MSVDQIKWALVAIVTFGLLYLQFIYPYFVYQLKSHVRKCGRIPIVSSFPFGIPVTLTLFRNLKEGQLLQRLAIGELKRPYKTHFVQTLFAWTMATRDPENIKAILSTKSNIFGIRDRIDIMTLTSGSGIFTQDGSEWKHSRTMLRPQFSKEQISRLTILTKHADTLIDEISKRSDEVEIQDLFHMFTMDTASEFLLGESVDSLKFSENSKGYRIVDDTTGESMYSSEFVVAYQWLGMFTLKRLILKSISSLVLWSMPEHRKYIRQKEIFIDYYVKKALNSKSDEANEGYVFIKELIKETRDPVVIRDQIYSLLIAGRDTTASTLSYSFYYFAKYPHLWEKVKEDVWSVFPDGPDSEITYEGICQLKYVHMYVKEVLRLSPVVPLNTRKADRDTTLPRGGGPTQSEPVFVPKGTLVSYSVYILHRDPEIYGPDAAEFRPERWEAENKLPNSPMYSWGYIPFNGGPRICLGQQFALAEAYVTIVKLALAFDKISPGKGFPHELINRTAVTSKVGGKGVPLILTPFTPSQ